MAGKKVMDLGEYLAVHEAPGKNRGVFAKCAIAKGTLLYEEKALAMIVEDKALNMCCSGCFVTLDDTNRNRCGGCRLLYYCSKECQTKDWKVHKAECKYYVEGTQRGMVMSTTLRLFLRLPLCLEYNSPECKLFKTLSGNEDKLPAELATKLLALAQIIKHMVDPSRQNSTIKMQSAEELCSDFCKLKNNSFGLYSDSLEECTSSIFLRLSFLNHSCDPNSICTNMRDRMRLVALRPIEAGEELSISYILEGDDTEERQRQLSSNYFFKCQCSICRDGPEAAYHAAMLDGYKCFSCGGPSSIRNPKTMERTIMAKCHKCNKHFTITKAKTRDYLQTKYSKVLEPHNLADTAKFVTDKNFQQERLAFAVAAVDEMAKSLYECNSVLSKARSRVSELAKIMKDYRAYINSLLKQDSKKGSIGLFGEEVICLKDQVLTYVLLANSATYQPDTYAVGIACYKRAIQLLQVYWGADHPLIQSLLPKVTELEHFIA